MTDRCLTWAPRVGGVAFAVALPVIGLSTFSEAPRTAGSIIALVAQLLLSGVVLILVISAWRRDWLGWVGALSITGFYLWTRGAAVPWNDASLISGGLPILGMLYAWNAERHRRTSPDVPHGPDPVVPRESAKVEWLRKRNSGKHSQVLDRASGEHAFDTWFQLTTT